MKVAITREFMTDIANAIRNRKNVDDTYKPSEMAKAILSIRIRSSANKRFLKSSNYMKVITKNEVNF